MFFFFARKPTQALLGSYTASTRSARASLQRALNNPPIAALSQNLSCNLSARSAGANASPLKDTQILLPLPSLFTTMGRYIFVRKKEVLAKRSAEQEQRRMCGQHKASSIGILSRRRAELNGKVIFSWSKAIWVCAVLGRVERDGEGLRRYEAMSVAS